MQKKTYTVYSYVDISFQIDFMHYGPKILLIFYYVISCKRRAQRSLEVTQCKGVDVLCFHKFMDHVCLQMLIVCLDKYSNKLYTLANISSLIHNMQYDNKFKSM